MNFSSKFGDRLVSEAMSWKGTPFFHNARKKGIGADCLGLVLGAWEMVNNTHYDYELDYAAPPNLQLNHKNIEMSFDDISKRIPISKRKNGDVICCQLSKQQFHLSFYTQKNEIEMLVHSRVKLGVVEESYSQFWKSKTFKMFRLMEV